MTCRKFWLAYLLVTVFSLTIVYVVVGTKEEMPLVLSDSQMQTLVGVGWYGEKCSDNPVPGCDPNPTGECLTWGSKWMKYYPWSTKRDCLDADPSDFCNLQDLNVTCKRYIYDDDDCDVWNRTVHLYYYTDCWDH